MNIQMTVMFGVFFALVGACVGSFLNVVIWRLPYRGREVMYLEKRGKLTLSWPPSHCPMCEKPIWWYQNIPVVSWLVLRGKCANSRAGIPIRYPLVELGTGMMFLGFYLAYFVAGWQSGVTDGRMDWPVNVLHVIFAASLLAASAIDADLVIIPLSIPWFLAVLGVVASALIGPPLVGKVYAIIPYIVPTDQWWWLAKPVIGTAVGLGLVNVMLKMKWLPRSFDEETGGAAVNEHKAGFAISGKSDKKSAKGKEAEKPGEEQEEAMAPPPKLTKYMPAVIAAIALMLLAGGLWWLVSAKAAALVGICAGILVFLIGVLPRDAGQVDVTDEVMEEITGPHVRREVLKEVVFLAVPVACGVLAHLLPLEVPRVEWLARVLGSVLGLLVGGGLVWLIRVGGSLGFGKEAMGMGDAHLMAGVGAVIGAPLAVIAFFMAPFLGIVWAIVLKILGKPNVLPYGPWLSVASILALLIGKGIIAFLIGG